MEKKKEIQRLLDDEFVAIKTPGKAAASAPAKVTRIEVEAHRKVAEGAAAKGTGEPNGRNMSTSTTKVLYSYIHVLSRIVELFAS